MSTSRRLWVPVLLAALVAMLFGPSAVTAAEPRTVTGKVMMPAAAFIPNANDSDYVNSGFRLFVDSGTGYFTAPLTFPVQTVRIKKITLYAYDNGAGNVCLYLYRASPPNGTDADLGYVCTSDSAAFPQVVSTTAISPRQANTSVASPYLWVTLTGPGLYVYGVTVLYSYET